MSGPEERQRAVDLYSATPMTTAQVVEHLAYPTRQCLERWPAKDPGYAGHMAKPIIPLETRTKAIEPVPGGMRQKRAAERLGAGVGAVRNRVRAYREGGMAALRPENRDAGQADKPAMRRDRSAGDAEAPRRRVEEPELGNAVMQEVVEAFASPRGRYGYRRVRALLRTDVLEKALRRIMAEDGLTAHVPERRGYGSYEGEATPAPGDLADRDFTAGMPNGKWPADITRDQGRGREGAPLAAGQLPRRQDRRVHGRFGPDAEARRQDARQGRGDAAGGGASPGAFRPRMPLPAARMAGAHGPLRPGAVDGRQRPFPGRRRRGGGPRTHEDGARLSRALGGAYPRRGTRPDRRLHPLARPRAHQTVARLDESGAIPSEPGNGCVTISKKTSTAPSITKQRMQRRTRINY